MQSETFNNRVEQQQPLNSICFMCAMRCRCAYFSVINAVKHSLTVQLCAKDILSTRLFVWCRWAKRVRNRHTKKKINEKIKQKEWTVFRSVYHCNCCWSKLIFGFFSISFSLWSFFSGVGWFYSLVDLSICRYVKIKIFFRLYIFSYLRLRSAYFSIKVLRSKWIW